MIYYQSLIVWLADLFLLAAFCASFITLKSNMKKVFVMFIIVGALAVYLILTIILQFIISLMFKYSLINGTISDWVYCCVYMFVKLNTILVLKRLCKRKKNTDETIIYFYQILIPIISVIGLIIVLFKELAGVDTFYILVYIYVLSLINIVAYYVFDKNEFLSKIYAEQKIENEMYVYREEYYKKLEEYYEQMRILKHDHKNQLISMFPYIKDSEEKEEITKILQQVDDMDKKYLYTRNQALNAILNQKRSLAEKYNIKSNFEVAFPEKVHISGNEIGRLIGNLLDNAIESLRNFSEERFIDMKIIYYNRSINIEIDNPVAKKVKNLNTDKNHKREHGLGSKSIIKIVEKYKGEYEWSSTSNMFHTSIIIWDQDT